MIGPKSSLHVVPLRQIAITVFHSRGGAMELSRHALSPVLPMSKLLIGEASSEGMMEQSLMSSVMRLSIDSPQSARFGLTKLMLPVDRRQHLTHSQLVKGASKFSKARSVVPNATNC
jgi:hypothetical protein